MLRSNRHLRTARRADGSAQLTFRYTVVRVWEQPVEAVLTGDLAWLPLASLTRLTPEELPAVVRRMEARLRREAAPERAADMWDSVPAGVG